MADGAGMGEAVDSGDMLVSGWMEGRASLGAPNSNVEVLAFVSVGFKYGKAEDVDDEFVWKTAGWIRHGEVTEEQIIKIWRYLLGRRFL